MVPRKTTPASTAPSPPSRTAGASRSSTPPAMGRADRASLTRERGVEGGVRRPEVHPLHERARLARARLAVHADVLPLDRQRSVVACRVEMPDDLLELDLASADRAELPVALGVAERQVTTEHAGRTRRVRPPDVLHVHVIDPFGEAVDERQVVHALIPEVARVVVEPERLAPAHRVEGALRR